MKKKIFGLAAAIMALLSVFVLAAADMARGGAMLLKVWVFKSLMSK